MNIEEILEVVPKKSIGPFKLGDNISNYFDVLGDYHIHFLGGDWCGGHTGYMYVNNGIRLDCDENEIIKYICVIPPCEVVYKGIKILYKSRSSMKLENVLEMLIEKRITFSKTDVGIWIDEANIGLIEYESFISGVELHDVK